MGWIEICCGKLGVNYDTGKAVYSQSYVKQQGQNTLNVNTEVFEAGNSFFQVVTKYQTTTK